MDFAVMAPGRASSPVIIKPVEFLREVTVPDETKNCIACFEPINAQARKCRHCYQVQNKLANAVNLPAVSAAAFAILLLALAWVACVIFQLGHKEQFNSQMRVARGRLAFPRWTGARPPVVLLPSGTGATCRGSGPPCRQNISTTKETWLTSSIPGSRSVSTRG